MGALTLCLNFLKFIAAIIALSIRKCRSEEFVIFLTMNVMQLSGENLLLHKLEL